MKRIRFYSTLCCLTALAMAVAGCGGDGAAEGNGLSGTIQIDGSSTVYPITEAVAEEFMIENPGVRITVGVSGTGGGFAKFGRGETDISDASRPIQESERALAAQNAIEFIELPVAYDGLVIVVNPQNDFVECLTVEELHAIWEPNSTVDTWDDVRPSFPSEEIHLYGPGTDSGTYDYFTAAIVGQEGASRADFTASEDDNVLVQGVAGDPSALGYFGMAYYEENADKLQLVGVDNGNAADGEGCVLPSVETVQDGTYQPLARPEFIYINAESASEPAVQAFVEFYLENAAVLAAAVGYVPLSEQAYELAMERFRNGVTGSMFEGGSQTGVRMEEILRSQPMAGGGAASDTTSADSL